MQKLNKGDRIRIIKGIYAGYTGEVVRPYNDKSGHFFGYVVKVKGATGAVTFVERENNIDAINDL